MQPYNAPVLRIPKEKEVKICACGNPITPITPCNVWVDIRGRIKCWICKPYNTGRRKALESRVSKICKRCELDLPIDYFYFKSSTGRRTRTPYCKLCIIDYNRERELNIKIELIKLRGGCCSKCGYKKNVYALDFHHNNPQDKNFNLAHTSGITQQVLDEIAKCDILCANCHREFHNPNANNLL